MTGPMCPSCGLKGSEHVVSTPSSEKSREGSAWFHIAHCDGCGHVYGVFTKHVFGRTGPQLVVEPRR